MIFVRVCGPVFLNIPYIRFLRKKGGPNVYLEGLKKEAIRAAHPYYVIYR